jgi:antitoxin component YwqK of YwqJK toxin-antitoxin module
MKTEKYELIRQYHKNGQLYYEAYRLNGKRHNTTGPAYKEWYDNGKLSCESYWINGELHNINGPAYRCWYGNGQLGCEEYFIEDKKLTKEQFENRKNCIENKVVEIDGKKYKLVNIEK